MKWKKLYEVNCKAFLVINVLVFLCQGTVGSGCCLGLLSDEDMVSDKYYRGQMERAPGDWEEKGLSWKPPSVRRGGHPVNAGRAGLRVWLGTGLHNWLECKALKVTWWVGLAMGNSWDTASSSPGTSVPNWAREPDLKVYVGLFAWAQWFALASLTPCSGLCTAVTGHLVHC